MRHTGVRFLFLFSIFLIIFVFMKTAGATSGGGPACPPCESWNGQRCVKQYDPNTEKCCGDGPCIKWLICCPVNCCDPNNCLICSEGHCVSKCDPNNCEYCGDEHGNCLSWCEPNTTCCYGNCCNRSCCDSWDCEYCLYGLCAPCLRKVSTYAALQGCNRVPDPSWTPQPNGCGPGGNDGISDDPANCSPPDNSSFKSACDYHDICYQTCGNPKSGCDSQFGDDMDFACAGNSPLCWIVCQAQRVLYWAAVAIVGESYYEEDQVAACACCDCN